MQEAGFTSSAGTPGRILTSSVDAEGRREFAEARGVVTSIGSHAIRQKLSDQAVEFSTAGKPQTFRVRNRAQKGNVKIWAAGFDSVMYPEGATDDRSTWLQPGETMMLPIDAMLHFFGNIFHPTFEGARTVIEACGGFLMEPKAAKINPNETPPRIIGGPLFLPDFIIEAIDGRNRVVGEPFELYAVYDKLTRKLRQRSILTDVELKNEEARVLEDRLREYRETDAALFDQYGRPIASEPEVVFCECSPIEHERGARGCTVDEKKPPKGKTTKTEVDDKTNDLANV